MSDKINTPWGIEPHDNWVPCKVRFPYPVRAEGMNGTEQLMPGFWSAKRDVALVQMGSSMCPVSRHMALVFVPGKLAL